MISSDELAAVITALASMQPEPPAPALAPVSRWKIAARSPELEMEELRALH